MGVGQKKMNDFISAKYQYLYSGLRHILCVFLSVEVIDVSDEAGSVKNLRQNLDDYGSDFLKERETVVLLRVESMAPLCACLLQHVNS